MVKNEEVVGVISSIGCNFEGVMKYEDYTCFVPRALPKEKVKVKVLKVKDKLAWCKIEEILAPSQYRARPKCSYFGKCGGCSLSHLSYKKQLELKKNFVKDTISKVAYLTLDVLPVVPSNLQYGYRNKVSLPVREENGEVKIGLYAENSHRIVPINNCVIQEDWIDDLITVLQKYLVSTHISCYSEIDNKGLLKHVVARKVNSTILVTFVINGDTIPKLDLLIEILSNVFQSFSIFTNINKENNNVILTDEIRVLYGEPFVETSSQDISYKIGPLSFYQVNNYIREKLYNETLKALDLNDSITVIDAYSGAGILTGMIAKRCKKAIGIEINSEANNASIDLAKSNGLTNMISYKGLCEKLLPDIIEKQRMINDPTYVVLDPPRKGCEREVIESLVKSKPEKIVYISCNPQTLARDLGILLGSLQYNENNLVKNINFNIEDSKYSVDVIKPFDMFPQTSHVETLVCLTLKK